MTISTFSSRNFNQDIARARRAAMDGPVIITDRGKPAQVLMSFEAYQRLTGGLTSLADALAQLGGADIAFDPPQMTTFYQAADLE